MPNGNLISSSLGVVEVHSKSNRIIHPLSAKVGFWKSFKVIQSFIELWSKSPFLGWIWILYFSPIDVKQQVWVVLPEHRGLSLLSLGSNGIRPKAKQKAMWCTGGSSERLIRVFVETVVGHTKTS